MTTISAQSGTRSPYKSRFKGVLIPSFTVFLGFLLAACQGTGSAPVVNRSIDRTTAGAATRSIEGVYTVKRGDTLYSIAQAHNMEYRELAALNSGIDANRLAIGQQLKIRSTTTASPITQTTEGGIVVQPIAPMGATVEQRPLDEAPLRPVEAGTSTGVNTATLKVEPKAGKEPYTKEGLSQLQSAPPPVQQIADDPKPEAKVAAPTSSEDPLWVWPSKNKILTTFNENGIKGIDIGGKAGDPVLAAESGKVIHTGTTLRGYGQLIIIKHNESFVSAYAHNQKMLVQKGDTVKRGQKIAEMGDTDTDRVKLHFEIRRDGKPVDPLKYLPPQ